MSEAAIEQQPEAAPVDVPVAPSEGAASAEPTLDELLAQYDQRKSKGVGPAKKLKSAAKRVADKIAKSTMKGIAL